MAPDFTSAPRMPKPSARRKLADGSALVVVGNGMVGCKLCEELIQKGLHRRLHTTVIGADPLPAYDRIKLSTYVDHRDSSSLLLHDRDWYESNNITLRCGDPVTQIDRDLKTIVLSSGERLSYDTLILATGSRPFVPPIEGTDLPNVFVYRTIADLDRIINEAEGQQSATVIGGGLLGLEAAQAAQKLGLSVSIAEQASFLMPRQLNATAASYLERFVENLGINVFIGNPISAIRRSGKSLTIQFSDETTLDTDLVIVSAGITPNSELAEAAGLQVGLTGGIVVDRQLETSDPDVIAIGECAMLDGRTYGLASPGFAMARHVAHRLQGTKTEPFTDPDLSTRLKMLGADVVTIGDPLTEGRQLEFCSDDCYRMLILGTGNVLRGGLGVGPWPESGRLQALYNSNAIIRDREQRYFTAEGLLSPQSTELAVAHWPETRLVCNCMSVTKGELVRCLAKCGPDPDLLATSTGASTVCGSCRPLVNEVCGNFQGKSKPIGVRSLLVISGIAFTVVLASILAPKPPMADSVTSWWYRVDIFWRDNIVKQVTGFSLLGLALGGLLFSLRKRFRWFRFGHFARWRVLHTLFGLAALVGLFAHTGFRFGHNLNFWLMFCFVGLSLLGACAGVVSALENSGVTRRALIARRWRPFLSYAHLVLFWPMPVLLTFHILSVYLY